MKFTTKTRYGIRAMLEIAMHQESKGVFQKDIASNQSISVKYLDHIIAALKANGLIVNQKGKKSGYTLSHPPGEITMLDIHRSFEPGIQIVDCLSDNFDCPKESICVVKSFWNGLNNQIVDYLRSTTLQDLLDKQTLLAEDKKLKKA